MRLDTLPWLPGYLLLTWCLLAQWAGKTTATVSTPEENADELMTSAATWDIDTDHEDDTDLIDEENEEDFFDELEELAMSDEVRDNKNPKPTRRTLNERKRKKPSSKGNRKRKGKPKRPLENRRTTAKPSSPTRPSPTRRGKKPKKNKRPAEPTPRYLSDEEKLLKYLFTDYNPSARPVMNSSKTVDVMIQFSLMHLKDLDVRSQVLTTTGLLILEWTDERLTWDPQQHNNLTEIIIEAKGLWRPEFAVINGAEKIYEDYNQFRGSITSEGRIHWEPGGVFKTMCEIDITYYPFDEQKCELQFGAWSYHTSKMNLTNSSHLVNLDSYKKNGEWEIDMTEVTRNEFFYECCPNERFSNTAFAIFLRRRHTFYVLNVILPSIMTSVLLLSVFFCTPGQKVQIGVVVLLSFRIFLLNVSGNIPKTSDHIPLLGIYLTMTMAITTLSMVLTVFVLNLHHVSDRPVPMWAKRLVFLYIARLIGMCNISDLYKKDLDKKKRGAAANYRGAIGVDTGEEERTAIIELHQRNINGTPEAKGGNAANPYPMLNKPAKDKDKKEDYAKDWTRMAEVFDRLFFWLFLFAILTSTLILFHPLTKASLTPKT